jgi:tetratricopeptide (TPR) repeat protein
MTLFKVDEAASLTSLRDMAEKAIALALRNKWTEAAEINRSILEQTSDDIDALNRLAKASLELAQMDDARETLKRVLALAPDSVIARRNFERLTRAEADENVQINPTISKTAFSLDIFMEEAGKSTTTSLIETGDPSAFQRLTGGEQVELVQDGAKLLVESRRGDHLGRIPPRLALRLTSLMDGGNRYAAAALHFADEEVRVIIREIYQEPSQSETPSFPPQKPDGFRPYVRSRSLVFYELEEPAVEAIEEPGDETDEQPDIADDDEKETQPSSTPKRGSFEASLDDEDESD